MFGELFLLLFCKKDLQLSHPFLTCSFYRPRSRGDNKFGSVRLFVCLCVCETQVSYTLKNIIECSSQGAFKMVGRSEWLFRQVAPSRSITLLIFLSGEVCTNLLPDLVGRYGVPDRVRNFVHLRLLQSCHGYLHACQ